MNIVKILQGKNNDVWEYVFESDDAIAETVLYRYESFEKRTVICCSVQSGCPVGCTFCGTGKQFVRNFSANEIIAMVNDTLEEKGIRQAVKDSERFQIMFMSMGEPLLNIENVMDAILELQKEYPNAELLVSTVGIDNGKLDKLIQLATIIDKLGLQFSIHKSTNEQRKKLIPYAKTLSIEQIAYYGQKFFKATRRKPFLNYCVDETNNTREDFQNLQRWFNTDFCFTFSVICDKRQGESNTFCDISEIKKFKTYFDAVSFGMFKNGLKTTMKRNTHTN